MREHSEEEGEGWDDKSLEGNHSFPTRLLEVSFTKCILAMLHDKENASPKCNNFYVNIFQEY